MLVLTAKVLEFNFRRAGRGGYARAKCVNVEEILFVPVLEGYWRQCELWDGTYTFDDLLDILEVIDVKHENERRAEEAAEMEQEARRNAGF